IDLIFVDTSAAYFLGADEISNTQMGAHARMLRSLTTLPGGPCVVPLCHPIKYVTEPSQLLPRGGGAFLAEMDGNLTLWLHDETLVTLHYNKIRGPGFEPITFKLDKVTTPALVDSKGRELPTVRAVSLSGKEEAEQEASAERDEDQLLAALSGKKQTSIADLARICDWLLKNGEPHKSKVDRVLKRLAANKLVTRVRGKHWQLTPKGKELVEGEQKEKRAEERGSATDSKKPPFALRSKKQGPTVPCA